MDLSAGLGARASSLGLFLLAACSGKTSPPKSAVEDARAGSSVSADDANVVPGGNGEVRIRVEWKDVPVDARRSPGRTSCGTPRPAAVEPTTLWGIPDVFVALDAEATQGHAPARIVVDPCGLAPRAAITSGTFTVASAVETPTKVDVQGAGKLPLGGAVANDKSRPVYLPIAGHAVEVPVEGGAIVRVIAGSEDAWVVATENPFIAVTESSGNVLLRDVPAGTHAITAWLPPRSGQPARLGRGEVTVTAGALAEVTVDISKP